MNKIFRIVWSESRAAHIVAHEKAATAGRPASTRGGTIAGLWRQIFAVYCATLPASTLAAPPVNALPTGGQVVAGSGQIGTNGQVMTVTQNTDRLVTNWQNFNIGANASVQFIQPSSNSLALNRIIGQSPSEIFGRLSANGQVMLLNPSGIVFGPGSQVNASALVASSLQISDQNFLAGNYRFANQGSAGSIRNQGAITTPQGGIVAFIAPIIDNAGRIDTPGGTTLLVAANIVSIDFRGDGLLNFTLDQGTAKALITNSGEISAAGGQVILSAKALDAASRSAINNSGLIEASSLVAKGGRIVLEADDITLASGSRLEAKGATGGGEVLVGGGWQGSGNIRPAITVNMAAGASIDGSATDRGDGGTVVLWSAVNNADSLTSAQGSIKADGGTERGDGGRIETSGHTIQISNIQVSTRAAHGSTGQWLIDPYNISIAGADATTSNSGGTFTASANGTSTIKVSTLLSALNNSAVTVTTTGAGSDAGNITVSSAIDDSALTNKTHKLTLNATNGIVLNAAITRTTGGLDLIAGAGGVTGSGAVTMNGGTLSIDQSGNSTYAGVFGGTGALTKAGAGNLTLSGLHSATGIYNINAGTLTLAPTGSGGFTFAGSGININNGSKLATTSRPEFFWGKTITFDANGGGTINFGTNVGAFPLTIRTLGGLKNTVTGAGLFNLSTDRLVFDIAQATGGGSALEVSNGTVNSNAASQIVKSGTGTLTFTGTFGSTTPFALNAGTVEVGANGTTGSIASSTISIASGAILKFNRSNAITASNTISGAGSLWQAGSGTLSLSGTNTYTGGTSINGGTLALASSGAIGSSGTISFGGGTLQYSTSNSTDYSNRFSNAANQAYSIDTNGQTVTLASALSSSGGSLAKSGNGTLILTGADTYSGGTTISGGTLQVGAGGTTGALGTGGVLNNAALIFNRSDNVTDANAISGTGSVQKSGSGTLTLSGANTYTGATTISAGTLFLDLGSATSLGRSSSYTGTGTLTLQSSGAVSQGTPILSVSNLLLKGTGSFTLDNVNNAVGVIAAGNDDGSAIGGLSFVNASALGIGTVGLSGIKAGGAVDISTLTGDLTVAQNVTGSSITLNAGKNAAAGTSTGGNILLTGTPTLTASTGRTLLYTGSVAGSSGITTLVGSGSGNFRYNSDEASSGFDTATKPLGATGTFAIYREQPTLTVTANNTTKTYDGLAFSGGNGITLSDYVNGDSGALPSDAVLYGGTSQGARNAGSYQITLGGVSSDPHGYGITYENGTLTINQRPITITADAKSKVYGNTDPSLTYQVTIGNLVTDDSLTVALTRAAGENIGSYTINASALANGNYLITTNNGALSISQRPITVTADSLSKVYGNSDPTLTYQVTSGTMVGGDSLTVALTRAAGENVGSYTIDASALANGNYLITANNGALSITQRPITVTADNLNKIYGNSDPALTYQVTSGTMVSGDTLTGALTRSAGENVGSYTIDVGTLVNGNYLITANNGALSITQRPITVTADNLNKIYGNSDPALTYQVTTGTMVSGDTLSGALTRSAGENVGSYTINASALANGNYLITANNGSLSISQRPTAITTISATTPPINASIFPPPNRQLTTINPAVTLADLSTLPSSLLLSQTNTENLGDIKRLTLIRNAAGQLLLTELSTTRAGIYTPSLGATAGSSDIERRQ